VTDHPTDRQGRILQQLGDLRRVSIVLLHSIFIGLQENFTDYMYIGLLAFPEPVTAETIAQDIYNLLLPLYLQGLMQKQRELEVGLVPGEAEA